MLIGLGFILSGLIVGIIGLAVEFKNYCDKEEISIDWFEEDL